MSVAPAVPLNVTVCTGLGLESVVNVSVPVNGADATAFMVGVNVTVAVQLDSPARVEPQVVVKLYPVPTMPILAMLSTVVLVLESVTVRVAEAAPTRDEKAQAEALRLATAGMVCPIWLNTARLAVVTGPRKFP
jgi:phage tail sheath protein FI